MTKYKATFCTELVLIILIIFAANSLALLSIKY